MIASISTESQSILNSTFGRLLIGATLFAGIYGAWKLLHNNQDAKKNLEHAKKEFTKYTPDSKLHYDMVAQHIPKEHQK
ncbi:unnamed protein product [Didymodactylos carnosus]|uniref:Uncharacterized protein n=1 Tax=Didymodactylos carnosus TaxID=1234261 RepID=A0A814AP95_9BILA|nr:unnamed protein product [Didymodactylos carnosus]CAF0917782.1 unnamed protein product [Didymodactylos carnosus]CAF3543470.1 unnamed protein product [Didymodactylos carnosus]CAF3697672.1 unnamed protein product [Didymodactylos carnosus]